MGECEGIKLNRRHHITIDGDRRGEERSKSEGEERHREQDLKQGRRFHGHFTRRLTHRDEHSLYHKFVKDLELRWNVEDEGPVSDLLNVEIST